MCFPMGVAGSRQMKEETSFKKKSGSLHIRTELVGMNNFLLWNLRERKERVEGWGQFSEQVTKHRTT